MLSKTVAYLVSTLSDQGLEPSSKKNTTCEHALGLPGVDILPQPT